MEQNKTKGTILLHSIQVKASVQMKSILCQMACTALASASQVLSLSFKC
jgi:hypothetical protein